MSLESFKDAIRQKDKIELMRLGNWGQSGRGGIPDFEPASWFDVFNEFLADDQYRQSIAERDAAHLEFIITTFDMLARANNDPKATGVYKFGTVWKTALLIKYKEASRPVSAMAEELRRRMKRRCAERTFRHHIHEARNAIFKWADPL